VSGLTTLYEKVPAPARSLMASVRGWQLRRWRYGADTERLTEEALARDAWDEAKWRAWREERLARLLHRAATRVPYYRAHWEERRRRGDTASFERLENWPVLGKQPLRERAEAFLADDADPRKMIVVETSGTTGTPVKLWRSRRTEREWYAIFEARLRRWNGVSLRDRWVNHGGARVTPGGQQGPPYWVWNAGPAPALLLLVPRDARRRAVLPSRRCGAIASCTCSAIRRRCTRSRAPRSSAASRRRASRS
jgi:phenylacetate-CoA ligase